MTVSETTVTGPGAPPRALVPALIVAALGAVSGVLTTIWPGPAIETGSAPVLMVLAGVWFGLVMAAAAVLIGRTSVPRAAIAIAGTWLAWEVAVNVAMMTAEGWLKATPLDNFGRYALGGLAAGCAGAGVTYAVMAALSPNARHLQGAATVIGLGGLLGLLLPVGTDLDTPMGLFLPWQTGVAAAMAWALTRPR